MNDKKAKEKMMQQMRIDIPAETYGVCEMKDIDKLCDELIRKGWRKG